LIKNGKLVYQEKELKLEMIFQLILILEPNGQIAHLLEQSEIKLIVVHVGLLQQLKLSMTECVLIKVDKMNQDQLLILQVVVDSFHASLWAVMVDKLVLLGLGLVILELYLVQVKVPLICVMIILCNNVLIMLIVKLYLVVMILKKLNLNVYPHAQMILQNLIMLIK